MLPPGDHIVIPRAMQGAGISRRLPVDWFGFFLPSPLAGEGGETERSEVEPGEG
jgi:hypothetical protein